MAERPRDPRIRTYVGGVIAAAALGATLVAADDLRLIDPPAANPAAGVQQNALARNYALRRLAQGSDVLENPSGTITTFGRLSTGARTEPDENTYLVTRNPGGPTSGYDYGRHFLVQGHENGSPMAYVTRMNLDVADPAHRITLLTPADPATGQTGLGSIDGSTWDPFTRTLLFTEEAGSNGGVFEIPLEWSSNEPPALRSLDCVLGKAGYEGIHADDHGNLYLAEDTGGTSVSIDPANIDATVRTARQPNSFVYKFVPNNPHDLVQGGTLYALQVSVGSPLAPVVFGGTTPAQAFADVYSPAQALLRAKGSPWPVQWVLVHDTGPSVDPATCAPFNANAAAKAANATPFKRPENLAFLPGSRFDTFYFDETGDTDAQAGAVPELARRGAWGSIFRVDFPWDNALGQIRMVLRGDAAHAAFDNMAFADRETLLVAEDRGDGLHDQLNALDSVWAFDVVDFDRKPRRLLALGRDPLAAPSGEEDNEPTGLHVSDGAASIAGLLGARAPGGDDDGGRAARGSRTFPFSSGREDGGRAARWFVTEQHGLNQLFEIVPR